MPPTVVTAERMVEYATLDLLSCGATGAGVTAGIVCGEDGGVGEDSRVDVDDDDGGGGGIEVEVVESSLVEVALRRILPPAGIDPLEPAV